MIGASRSEQKLPNRHQSIYLYYYMLQTGKTMKIPFPCTKCLSDGVVDEGIFAHLTPLESGLYDVRCERGHSTQTILQQMRFEMLFELGVTAILDGYYREAITSFASSLERFLEFYILMVFKEKKADEKLRRDVWKMVAAQSERQLGAYLFLYALHENGPAPYLSDKEAKFRNDVVHKGRFPTEKEAIDFGNSVLKIMRPMVRKFKERSHDLLMEAVHEHMNSILSTTKGDVVSMCYNTTVSLSSGLANVEQDDITERIKSLKTFQRMTGNPHGH